jgi:phosphatidylglycerophosphatase A
MLDEALKLKVATHISRVTPLGLVPAAPGTAGAVFGALLAVAAWRLGFAAYFAALSLVVFIGTWAVEVVEKHTGIHDDRRVVIDEVAGMMLSLAGWERPTLLVVILAFVGFRALDILKPWPISALDRRVGGGFGCMADDLAAGVLCIVLLEILRPFL